MERISVECHIVVEFDNVVAATHQELDGIGRERAENGVVDEVIDGEVPVVDIDDVIVATEADERLAGDVGVIDPQRGDAIATDYRQVPDFELATEVTDTQLNRGITRVRDGKLAVEVNTLTDIHDVAEDTRTEIKRGVSINVESVAEVDDVIAGTGHDVQVCIELERARQCLDHVVATIGKDRGIAINVAVVEQVERVDAAASFIIEESTDVLAEIEGIGAVAHLERSFIHDRIHSGIDGNINGVRAAAPRIVQGAADRVAVVEVRPEIQRVRAVAEFDGGIAADEAFDGHGVGTVARC